MNEGEENEESEADSKESNKEKVSALIKALQAKVNPVESSTSLTIRHCSSK